MKILRNISEFVTKHITSVIGAVFIFSVTAVLFFNLFPFNVAEFKNIQVKSDTSVGGILEYTNEYCQNVQKGTDRTLRRFLVPKDSTLVNPIELSSSPEDETLQGAGCRTSVPIKIPVNVNIPAGEYKLRVKACYDVFLRVRCIPVQGESDYFKISKLNVEDQLSILNQKIDEVNEQLKQKPYTPVANTMNMTIPQVITPPFSEPQIPTPQQPTTSTPVEPPETCTINLLGIKLLCR